jgi:hypothetical protein
MSDLPESKPHSNVKPTTRKLNWVGAMRYYNKVNDFDYRVVSCIADHIQETGDGRVSDAVIAIKIGQRRREAVTRSRLKMRKLGVLDWTRVGDHNVYRLKHDRVLELSDDMKALVREHQRLAAANKKTSRWASPNKAGDVTAQSHSTVRTSLSRGSSQSQRDTSDSSLSLSQKSLPSKRDKKERRAASKIPPDRVLSLVVPNDPFEHARAELAEVQRQITELVNRGGR